MPWTGELIAIATVLCWTISVQFFEAASKRVGATPVNIIRLTVALMLFSLLLFFRHGYIFPVNFPAHAWFYLSLSGVVGFFIGDIFLFKALVEIGPRVAMLIFSLSAPTAALIGWLFLDEIYVPHQWVGMFVTLFGVGIVILERNQKASKPSNQGHLVKGCSVWIWGNVRSGMRICFEQNRHADRIGISGCIFCNPDQGDCGFPLFSCFLYCHWKMGER